MIQLRSPHLRLIVTAPAVAMTFLQAGCASRYDDLKVFVQKHEQDVVASEYTIEPPDVLAFSSPTCPELQGEEQVVGPDGKITLRLVGEVKVAGMTPREVSARLRELLAVYYTDPEVSVRVASPGSKKVFVFGEVFRRGALPFTGRDSVLDVLAAAQMSFYAWGSQVKIIRPGPTPSERHEIVVDVDHMIQTGDTRGNVLLQEGDIIYVPPTPLAWMGMRIQEVLFPLRSAADTYSTPATFIGATDYYQDHGKNRSITATGINLSPGVYGSFLP
jgi:polysaccharide export outer membrane protein